MLAADGVWVTWIV